VAEKDGDFGKPEPSQTDVPPMVDTRERVVIVFVAADTVPAAVAVLAIAAVDSTAEAVIGVVAVVVSEVDTTGSTSAVAAVVLVAWEALWNRPASDSYVVAAVAAAAVTTEDSRRTAKGMRNSCLLLLLKLAQRRKRIHTHSVDPETTTQILRMAPGVRSSRGMDACGNRVYCSNPPPSRPRPTYLHFSFRVLSLQKG
jgi:hypothetical protein